MAFEKMRAPPLVPVDAPPPPVGALAGQLARIVGEANVSIDPSDRMQSASDMWPKAFLWRRLGLAPAPPDVVVRPGTEQEIADVVRFAAEWGTPVTPHGAGSGVCGGALPVRGGITLRLDRLDRILRIDREALTVDVEAGVLGIHLEEALRRQGLTLGHFPSSIGCSTVGGWLAARSAGQCSSRYGKIEDMVRSMRCVVGTGAAIDLARPASGVDWTELMLGSEGVFGVVTRARLRLWPAPEIVLPRGFRFPSQRAGLAAVEAIFRAGLRPSVVRLYDPLSTEVALGPLAAKEKESAHGERPPGLDDLRPDFRGDTASRQALERLAAVGRRYVRPMPPAWRGLVQAMVPALREDDHEEGLGSAVRETLRDVTGAGRNLALSRPGLINRASSMSRRSLLVLVHEGARGEVEPEAAEVRAICAVHGGKDLGGAPGGRWLRDRYAVSYGLPRIFESHGWVDTFEVAAPWGRVATVYDAVRSAVSPHALVMAHFSHAYPDGCSIYFTFVGDARRPEEGLAVYDAAWSAALDAATAEGATLTHHHGVGLLKEPWLRDELGEAGLELLRRMKREWDPAGILNPGKLGLDGPADRASDAASREMAAPEREGQRGPDEAVDRESAAAERETAAREDEAERVAARHDRTGGLGAGDGERARERHAFHLDRSRLTGIDPVDERAMWIRAYAGAAVADVEARLRARGLTLGSQPPSIFLGTVGDWLEGPFAGRRVEGDRLASGVASVEAVLEGGLLLISHAAPRSAAGPAVAQLLLGGGGRQGQLVAATLKAEPFPRTTRFAFAGPAKTLARWLLACVRDPLPPIRIEAIGGDPPSANLTFAAGTDRLAARNGRAMALARSLGLQEVAPPGVREPAGQGAGTELETEKWLDQLASLPAGTRLDLFRISRESAVVVEGSARKEGWSPDGSTRLGQIR